MPAMEGVSGHTKALLQAHTRQGHRDGIGALSDTRQKNCPVTVKKQHCNCITK